MNCSLLPNVGCPVQKCSNFEFSICYINNRNTVTCPTDNFCTYSNCSFIKNNQSAIIQQYSLPLSIGCGNSVTNPSYVIQKPISSNSTSININFYLIFGLFLLILFKYKLVI
jgi:hypothetical protein